MTHYRHGNTHLNILILSDVSTFDPEDTCLGVVVNGFHSDGKSCPDFVNTDAPSGSLILYLPKKIMYHW